MRLPFTRLAVEPDDQTDRRTSETDHVTAKRRLPVEMSEPDGRLHIVADDDLPRVSDNLDLSCSQCISEGGITAVSPAGHRRTATHRTYSTRP